MDIMTGQGLGFRDRDLKYRVFEGLLLTAHG